MTEESERTLEIAQQRTSVTLDRVTSNKTTAVIKIRNIGLM